MRVPPGLSLRSTWASPRGLPLVIPFGLSLGLHCTCQKNNNQLYTRRWVRCMLELVWCWEGRSTSFNVSLIIGGRPEVILTLDVTQCCEFKQVTEYRLRSQSLKECVLRYSHSRNRTQQNQFVSPSTAHCSVALIIIIIITGSYYAFRVRLNAFTKMSKIK